MGPGRHIDSLELQLLSISEAVSVGHFGALVSSNYAVQGKIESLVRAKKSCEKEASRLYEVDETALKAAAYSLQERLIAGNQIPASDAGCDVGEFLVLEVMGNLLEHDFEFYTKLFFPDVTSMPKLCAERDAVKARRAVLEGALLESGELTRIGYTTPFVSWLGSDSARVAIAAACQLEMRRLAEAIEQIVTELDHIRAELARRGNEGRNVKGHDITTLIRQRREAYAKVVKYLRTWTFWANLDTKADSPTLGRAKSGWEDAAAGHADLLLRQRDAGAAGASRSFPWDKDAEAGGKSVPRRIVLKYLDIISELLRSREEFETMLPYDLRRAVRYYLLYHGDILAVLAKINGELEAKLAVIDSHVTKEATVVAAKDVSDLLYRRSFLARRLIYVNEQRRRGDAAIANWFAKGKPLTADFDGVEAPTIGVGTGDGEEEGPFEALPLLAAGGAARAALLVELGEQEEGDEGELGEQEEGDEGEFGEQEEGDEGELGEQEEGDEGELGEQEEGDEMEGTEVGIPQE